MTDPNSSPYRSPEEQAYHEESLLTRQVIQAKFDEHTVFIEPKGYGVEMLSLTESLTGATWNIQAVHGVINHFERFFVNDVGEPTVTNIYFFDEVGGLRGYARDYTAYKIDEKIDARIPPQHVIDELSEEERKRLFAELLSALLPSAFETFDLERQFDEDIVEPDEQQQLRSQLADAIPIL